MMNDPIMKAILLRKGDGNYGLFGGKFHAFRYPPPEAHVEDPNMPDVPAFAHTGGHGEEETGVPGTGAVIPGDWAKGRHGENVWVDKSGGEHMHGMDGIIRAVGDSMLEHGLNVPAKDIVQKAIDNHNADKHESEHAPNVDDPAWRKLHLAPFNKGGSIRGPNGELITTFTNRHGKNHALGTFLESYSNPIHKHLGQVMTEAGHPNAGKHSWVERPYIKPHRLHYVPDGQGGLQSGVHAIDSGQMGTHRGGLRIPGADIQGKWEGRVAGKKMFQDVSSWGTAHHFPPPYYLNQLDTTSQAPTKLRPKTLASFVHHMKAALGLDPEAIANNTIVDSSAARKYIAGLSGDIDGVPLKALLSSGADEDLMKVAQALQGYPAFQAVYGDNPKPGFLEDGSLNPKRRGSTVGKLNHHYGTKYGDKAPEGRGLDQYMSHSQRIGSKHLHRPGIATGDTRTMGGHARSLDHWSNVLLGASMGVDHAEHDLHPDELRNAGIMLHDTPEEREKVPKVKALIDSLNPINLIARGIEPKEIPSQQELEELAPYVDDVLHGGTSEDRAMMGVPDHIRYIETTNPMISSSPPIAPSKSSLRGAPAGVSGAPLPQGGTTAATRVPPPSPPPSPVAVRQTQVDPATPGLTHEQQMRAQFGHADQETVRRVMAHPALNQSRYLDTGEAAPSYPPRYGLPTDEPSPGQDPAQWAKTGLGTPEAAARLREQQFQSVEGDPWQTRLNQYTKSGDNPEAAKDRLIKAVEILQIEDAKKDDEIIKHVSDTNMNSSSTDDIHFMARKMDIAPIDVHTILNTKGDWKRISKRYGYQDEVVKVVKVSFGGV